MIELRQATIWNPQVKREERLAKEHMATVSCRYQESRMYLARKLMTENSKGPLSVTYTLLEVSDIAKLNWLRSD